MFKKSRWLKLDNAAKLFPYISKPTFANVFRISVNLYEDINIEVLEEAVNDIKNRFPMFFVKMRTGAFWYYYEVNERKFKIKKESPFICEFKNKNYNNGYLLDIFTYHNRLSVEVFHALSDATSTMELVKSILYRYFELLGKEITDINNEIIKYDSECRTLELEDSFNRYYREEDMKRFKPVKAYKIKAESFYIPGNGLIIGKLNSDELYKVSKKYDVTVTQYLSCVLMHSIYKYMMIYNNKNTKPISIVLPVNLRKFFDSETLRNFSLYIYLVQQMKFDLKFEDFIQSVKNCYKEQLNVQNLQATLNANMELEKNTFLKYCPLIFKKIAVKLGYSSIAGGLASISFSNFGKVDDNGVFNGLIEDVEFIAGGTEYSHSSCVITYNNITSISFTRTINNTEIEKEFFRFLTKEGLEVEIISNLWEDN